MNLAEFVYGWQFNKTVKANNTLIGYQQRNAPPFSEPTPSPYTKLLQNLTVSNLTASQDVREVQYASSSINSLIANDSGLGTYSQLAMRFTLVDRANLTGIWIYYASALTASLNVVNASTNTDKTPNGYPTFATYTLPLASKGWHFLKFNNPLTLRAGFYYWIVINATGSGGALVDWYYINDIGGAEDNKCASVYTPGGWINEAVMHATLPYLNLMLMLDVLPVNPANPSQVRTYSSPSQVAMNETNSNTQLSSSTTSIDIAYSTFALRANTSVTMAVNWTAAFWFQQTGAVSTHYVAENGFTQWTVNFTSGGKPNPTTYPYTWVLRYFTVMTIPQFWNGSAQPPAIWDNQSYAPSPMFFFAPMSYTIIQMNNLTTDPWNAKWGISAKSTYRVAASMPSQVVVGLPLTLNVSTAPYSPSLCNVSFYNPAGFHSFSRNVSIPFPSTSVLVPLRLNETGIHTLYLFDQSNDLLTSSYEVSLNETLTINVLPADCNVTVTGRTSPVIGKIGALKFKFYNNTLGNVVIPPLAVSVNGTLTTNFAYDGTSGNTTVYMNTASGGWRTGNNTLMVSAKSGVYNATKQTWIVVQRPLCNVTVVSVNQPFLGGTASLSFKFFNKTLGAAPVLIDPASVKINGTSVSFTYSSGVVTTTWNTATGGWHVGLNHVNVSATLGIFSNYTVAVLTIIKPLCNVTVTSVNSPILGNPATAQFRFLNNTAGGAPMPPLLVRINGTIASFAYASGVTTVSWSTGGGWRSGLNHVNITAISGVFSNSTVYTFTIIAPNATLVLSATLYFATYGDSISVGFTFMNMTGGTPHPFPSSITLYRNGTSVTPTDLGGGLYTYILNTRYFPQAGSYHVNFTAHYGTYTATNITAVALFKIPMSLSIQTPQTSVTIGSSLSVSATLVYGNGTSAPDGFAIQFNFIVTYSNGSVTTISKAAVINSGAASSSLLATGDMKSVNVNATYAGNGITASASDLKQNIQVVASQGLSLMMIALIGGGGGALVVALVGVLKYRGRRKRTEVTKTKALVQTASLAQLIVVHLASGRALYSRSIGSEEGADPNLISGFLSANQSIITEVFKKQPGAGLKFADYGEYKVVSNVGNYVMATLFCTETAGEELQGILRSFTEKFEKKYAPVLQSWDGNMNAFKDADNIADDVFSLPLCSPYMLLDTPIAKLSRDERAAVHSARILSGERGVFFMPRVVDFLLTKQNLKRGKAMDVINSLTKKGVFRQLTIEQAAQVVKSTTEQAGNQA
jgi:hypothetical protein